MKLHLDKDAFGVLLEDIHSRTGYRTDVLEKDYYVVLILSELAEMQKDGLPAYFKGGTALYKALKTTNRFSEDIDLSVDTRNCSRSQSVKRLERATKKYGFQMVLAAEDDLTLGGRLQSRQHIQHGGLTGTAAARDADEFALPHGHIHAI